MNRKSVWEKCESCEKIIEFAESYKGFLNCCKTERETVTKVIKIAKACGFENLDEKINKKEFLRAGDKVYVSHNYKTVALFVIGKNKLTDGMHLICSHADSPRLDIRSNPMYEKEELLLMKTHYYGGIKKYQWASIPLAMHGVVVKKNGTHVNVSIGEKEDEPVFYISDLPKHLSANQSSMTMDTGIKGEDLNIITGSIPLSDMKSDKIKNSILNLLENKYKIEETDFVSAELEIVPAGKARDVGIDGGLIAAYGHDDRICLYTSLRAILDIDNPENTVGILCVDKEEVGSVGHTGMNSNYLEDIVTELCVLNNFTDLYSIKRSLKNSKMLSADVLVGMDPNYLECFEQNNTAKIGFGPVIMKYGGHNGKKGCNDASAEFIAYIRDLFDNEDITWQTGEMGRIDLGGGGTMAPFAANFGMEVLDCGIALLGMHAPYELASKADVFETYRAYRAFLLNAKSLSQYI